MSSRSLRMWVGLGVWLALWVPFSAARAQSTRGRPAAVPAPLACGVDWKRGPIDPDRFCLELGAALGRPIVRVDDARTVRLGESVQVFSSSDEQWVVAALRDGKVLAWMTVSKAVGRGHEAFVIAGALSALTSLEVGNTDACLHLTAKVARGASTEILYPWEELRSCIQHVSGVADPWTGESVPRPRAKLSAKER